MPKLSESRGSCTQDDGKGGQVCTDFFSDLETIRDDKNLCQPAKPFVSAAWSNTPCGHSTSHGGCWSATMVPARIRWFYGEMNKDFKPGPDTFHVCGVHSIGFRPDGIPVRVDGSPQPEDGRVVHDNDAGL